MNLFELKKAILDNTLDDKVIIFKYVDDTWLVNSYIDYIAKSRKLNKIYVINLQEVLDINNDIFEVHNDSLYILNVDKFEDDLTKYDLKNVIIKTKDVTCKESEPYVVKFDNLEPWQIEDYAKMCLPGLKEDEVKWLCEICKHDIHRVDMECKKISIFNKSSQELIFKQINDENGYTDLNTLTIFNFTNAILKKDKKLAKQVLDDIENIDVEPTGVVTILYKNFKNIINIQMNPKCTAESLGISSKQFNAIQRNCGVYNNVELIRIFELISSIDYKLKSGYLSNERIVDYLITNIL